MRTLFAIAALLALAGTANAQQSARGWQDYDTYESSRQSYAAQQQLDGMRRPDPLPMFSAPSPDAHPLYVPYGGYQEPYYGGPYVGTGRR